MERNNLLLPGHTTSYPTTERRVYMKYIPAVLTDEHIHQLKETEQQLSAAAGEELILVAYAQQPDEPESLDRRKKTD